MIGPMVVCSVAEPVIALKASVNRIEARSRSETAFSYISRQSAFLLSSVVVRSSYESLKAAMFSSSFVFLSSNLSNFFILFS